MEAQLLAPTITRRVCDKLTATAVARLRQRRLHSDGLGLYLDLRHLPARSWAFRFVIDGQRREMGLGPVAQVSLAQARVRRDEMRKLVAEGIDPIERRRAEQRERREKVKPYTFEQAVDAYIAAHAPSWRSAKYTQQYRVVLELHAFPVIGNMAVKDIDTPAILRVLQPIWTAKTDTASRVRQHIEAVLDSAKVAGHRGGENPARWRGHLDKLLASPPKVAPTRHFRAMPYAQVPAFMGKLAEQTSVAALSLRFLILTACRREEMRGARWEEFDSTARTWTIPASRTKAGREHRVPLAGAAIAVLDRMAQLPRQERVFPVGETALLMVAQSGGATVHGFRSSFRDWAAERSRLPSEVAEMALAHAVGTATEAAYRRTDLFEKRRRLAEQWAAFTAFPAPAGAVVPLTRRA